MIRLRRSIPAVLLLALAACSEAAEPPQATEVTEIPPPDPTTWGVVLTEQPVDVEVLWVSLSPVDADTVWLSGTAGTWARTVNGGDEWETGVVPGTEELQFRDVEAFDASTAVLMTAGTGEESRIFRTEDAGATWIETFRMMHPEGFIDCLAFWDDDRGILYGDAIDGGLWVATTADGGRSWSRIPPNRLPAPIGSEGGFAASGTCVDVRGSSQAWIGTATTEPRILATEDGGESWSVIPVPLRSGEGAGVTSLGVRPDGLGYAVGGALDPDAPGMRTATSADGGYSWTVAGDLAMTGAPYGGAWLPDPEVEVLFATGPTGLDWSVDFGATWTNLSTENHWAVDFGSPRVGWAVGANGRITRIEVVEGAQTPAPTPSEGR